MSGPPRSRWDEDSVERPTAGAHLLVRLVLGAGALAVCLLWWQQTPAGSLSAPGGLATAAGRIAGLLGAYLVLVQVLLLARLPWFERAVGFDRLTAWHRGLGTNVVLLLSAHVVLIGYGYGATGHRNAVYELVTIVRTLPDMLSATAAMLLLAGVAISSARAARRRLSYEAWYWLHLTTYLAVALSFLHQVSTGADFVGAGHAPARLLWTALYATVAVCVLGYRVVVPGRGWLRHRMVVERVVHEAPGVVSVWIRGRRLEELGAAPGQFLSWRFLTPGHLWSAHPYSLSAAPSARHLRITVKDAGDHSRATAYLRPGVPVLAEGPFGHFTAAAATRARVLLVAGGSGIAPIRALAEDFARQRRDVVVLYRTSRTDDLALGHELYELAARRLITVHWLVGRRAELGYDPLAASHLRRLVPDVAVRDAYVCGPPGMTRTVVASLRRLRVPNRQIHTEEFAFT
jgi:ferredoxin-NADP reductase/DMSO/TMAO reductase YedYZ heme-binding membrane subunit